MRIKIYKRVKDYGPKERHTDILDSINPYHYGFTREKGWTKIVEYAPFFTGGAYWEIIITDEHEEL